MQTKTEAIPGTARYSKQCYDIVIDQWSHELDCYEFRVVMFLARHSVGYGGRPTVQIGYGQMVNGIVHRDNPAAWYTPPIGMTRNKLIAVIKSLSEKGFISFKSGNMTEGNTYTVNLNRSPSMPLPVPKRKKQQEPLRKTMWSDDPEVVHGEGYPSAQHGAPQSTACSYREDKREDTGEDTSSAPLRAAGDVSASRYQTTAQAFGAVKNQSREILKPVSPDTKITAKHYEAAWREAWAECFPETPCMAWTRAQQGMVNTLAKKFDHAGGAKAALDFVGFAVRTWTTVRAEKRYLGWRTESKLAQYPSIQALVSQHNIEAFQQAYAERNTRPDSWNRSVEAEIKRGELAGKSREQVIHERGVAEGMAKARAETKKVNGIVITDVMAAEAQRKIDNEKRREANLERARQQKEAEAAKPAPDLTPVPEGEQLFTAKHEISAWDKDYGTE